MTLAASEESRFKLAIFMRGFLKFPILLFRSRTLPPISSLFRLATASALSDPSCCPSQSSLRKYPSSSLQPSAISDYMYSRCSWIRLSSLPSFRYPSALVFLHLVVEHLLLLLGCFELEVTKRRGRLLKLIYASFDSNLIEKRSSYEVRLLTASDTCSWHLLYYHRRRSPYRLCKRPFFERTLVCFVVGFSFSAATLQTDRSFYPAHQKRFPNPPGQQPLRQEVYPQHTFFANHPEPASSESWMDVLSHVTTLLGQ